MENSGSLKFNKTGVFLYLIPIYTIPNPGLETYLG